MPVREEARAAWRAVALALLLLPAVFAAAPPRPLRPLQPSMPHVCAEQKLTLVGHRQPCVQAFSHIVPVWRSGCGQQAWCIGQERRTVYYMSYRQVYATEARTVFRCCPGWSQKPGQEGCLSAVLLELTSCCEPQPHGHHASLSEILFEETMGQAEPGASLSEVTQCLAIKYVCLLD
ncbi:hypothetical protein A6R68_16921 [Neotoma lepida]|uniref:EMI domain-containing protein n=1 Tax=Neotoma lepida TaxID=56216 RepID=A0A1A6HEE7_NEOLE|nr:hypothetical protein A6R68_16921 [Neotoma lepida]